MKAAVVGTTSWGTTLAILLARQGIETDIITRNIGEAQDLNSNRQNVKRLPNHIFPDILKATADKHTSIAVPSSSYRDNISMLKTIPIRSDSIFISATKGLEKNTGYRMSEVFSQELSGKHDSKFSALSGPNLAHEIVDQKPGSTVIASKNSTVATKGQNILNSEFLRVYTNTDLTGVELGGSLKNIVAIGAGFIDGMGLGDNSKSAFISRAIAEITRLGIAAGAELTTFAGLACLGDLLATCYSNLSRNRYVGEKLAAGDNLEDILLELGQVAEGIDTVSATLLLAKKLNVTMPITEQTYLVLNEGLDPKTAITRLMTRVPKPEDPLWNINNP
jgi:glycerol-3-phosphate dehydrogenase (NAD(P)+)